jgi:hypothetical protein
MFKSKELLFDDFNNVTKLIDATSAQAMNRYPRIGTCKI